MIVLHLRHQNLLNFSLNILIKLMSMVSIVMAGLIVMLHG